MACHLEYKHVRLHRAEWANNVDARSVVVVDALPGSVDGSRGPGGVCLCPVLVLQPAVAEVELRLDFVVQPGGWAQGHTLTR